MDPDPCGGRALGEALVKDPESGEYKLESENLDTAFDTVVEVIDVSRGRVLASARVEAFLRDFVGDGWAISYGTPDREVGIPPCRCGGCGSTRVGRGDRG